MKLTSLATALFLVTASGAASAAFVDYSASIPSGAVPYVSPYVFSLNKFDSSFGTLTGITLTLVSNINAEVDVFNSTGIAQNFTSASAALPITVTSTTADTTSVTATATASTGSGIAAVGFNAFPGLTSTATALFNVAASNFSNYIGTSGQTVAFNATAGTGNYSGSAAPGVFFSGSGSAGGNFTIRYTYDEPSVSAVPLPAAAWLMVSGIGAFGAAARRRKVA